MFSIRDRKILKGGIAFVRRDPRLFSSPNPGRRPRGETERNGFLGGAHSNVGLVEGVLSMKLSWGNFFLTVGRGKKHEKDSMKR